MDKKSCPVYKKDYIFFFDKCTKMQMVSLKRKYCKAFNDNIFYGIQNFISSEKTV